MSSSASKATALITGASRGHQTSEFVPRCNRVPCLIIEPPMDKDKQAFVDECGFF